MLKGAFVGTLAGLLVVGAAQAQPVVYTWTGYGKNVPGEFGQWDPRAQRPERGFETTLGKNGAIKTAAIVGGGGMMDVIGQIKEGDSKIKLYGYCEFEGPLTKKAGS